MRPGPAARDWRSGGVPVAGRTAPARWASPARHGCALAGRRRRSPRQDGFLAGVHRAGPAARPRPVRRWWLHRGQRLAAPSGAARRSPCSATAREAAPALLAACPRRRPGPRRRAGRAVAWALGSAKPTHPLHDASLQLAAILPHSCAAKASLHKARRRLCSTSPRTAPTSSPPSPESPDDHRPHRARRPRPGRQPVGLAVLADDAGTGALLVLLVVLSARLLAGRPRLGTPRRR